MQSCTAEDNIAGSMVATHSSGQWLLLLLALMLVASTFKPCSDPGTGTHTKLRSRHTHYTQIQAHTGGSDPGRGTHTKLHVEMFTGNLTPCVNRLSKLLHRGEILKIFNFNDDKVSAQHCRWQNLFPLCCSSKFYV